MIVNPAHSTSRNAIPPPHRNRADLEIRARLNCTSSRGISDVLAHLCISRRFGALNWPNSVPISGDRSSPCPEAGPLARNRAQGRICVDNLVDYLNG